MHSKIYSGAAILSLLLFGTPAAFTAENVKEKAQSEVKTKAVSNAAAQTDAVSIEALSVTEEKAASDVSDVPHASDASSFRMGKELQTAVRSALKRWKNIPSAAQAENAAHELLGLYHELEADTELSEKAREKLTHSVSCRLAAISRIIKDGLDEENKTGETGGKDGKDGRKKPVPQNVKLPDDKTPEAAQFGGAMNGGLAGAAGAGAGNDAHAQRTQESGEQLVELIQNTIHPDSWEVNGGSGRIMYWNQSGNLIIRQTDANHEEIQNLLDQLRRAGS